MILSGKEILKRMECGDIKITPHDEKRVNPNSYNLSLHKDLLVYEDKELDMAKQNATRPIEIPPEGLLLVPGILYLGRTTEHTETDNLVPMLEGRSSVGRLGMFIHVTAGFGDVGFKGYWTLEITCVQPIRIYAGTEICQMYFHTIDGEHDVYDNGKYSDNVGIQASKLYEDFKNEEDTNE